jgi:AMMECR1 domain-containing protein
VAYGFELASDEQRELLRIARATLREYADSGRIPPGKPHRPSLVGAAQVTVRLRRGDDALGEGVATEEQPLYRAIQEQVAAAAAQVERAAPLDDHVLDTLTIEIEIITTTAPIYLRESPRAT